jgi:hypothetical protein
MARSKNNVMSEEAWQIMARGFAAGAFAKDIARQIHEATKEVFPTYTIQRYAVRWRRLSGVRRTVREWMHNLQGEAKAHDLELSEMIIALACDQLEEHPDILSAAEPMQVQKLGLQGEALQLRGRQVEVQEHKLDLDERRMELTEEREKLAIAALEEKGKGEELSPEERIARVRAIYGLSDASA